MDSLTPPAVPTPTAEPTEPIQTAPASSPRYYRAIGLIYILLTLVATFVLAFGKSLEAGLNGHGSEEGSIFLKIVVVGLLQTGVVGYGLLKMKKYMPYLAVLGILYSVFSLYKFAGTENVNWVSSLIIIACCALIIKDRGFFKN